MEREIRPEPTPQELEAIEEALARLATDRAPETRSAWWRAGVAENVSEEEEPA